MDQNSTINYEELAKLVLRKTVLAQVCGIGPGAICAWNIENSLEDLTTLLALFRVGAVAFPIPKKTSNEQKLYFEKKLGIGYFFENKKWNELKNNEVYSWYQPPGPGVLFYQDELDEFIFHSEKKLVLAAKDSSTILSLNTNSNTYSAASMDSLQGLSLLLLPTIVQGASLSLLKELKTEADIGPFSHLFLELDQLKKFCQYLKSNQMILSDSLNLKQINNEQAQLNLISFFGHFKVSPIIFVIFKNLELEQVSNFNFKIEDNKIHVNCPYISPSLEMKNEVLKFKSEDWINIGLGGKIKENKILEIRET